MQAIVLAGGFGTRLKSAIGEDIPKPMAPLAGEPFLAHYLRILKAQGITEALLCVHHLRHTIMNYFGDAFEGLKIRYAEEEVPLGTGGAVQAGLRMLKPSEAVYVSNGDTFVGLNIPAMAAAHRAKAADLTIALREMPDCKRYGQALCDEERRITAFRYPGNEGKGLISTGCYMVSPQIFDTIPLPESFSFEADYQRPYCATKPIYGFVTHGHFLDIGIPEDYAKAREEISTYTRP